MKIIISRKKLKKPTKRDKQKYLVLISDQTVIIDTEMVAMKRATKYIKGTRKRIVDMLPTYARINAQVNNLSKLLESLETAKS